MSARGRKIGPSTIEMTSGVEENKKNVFEEAFEQAKNTEIPPETPKIDEFGAKNGVFEPPKVVEEPKKEEKPVEETGNKPSDSPNALYPDKERSIECDLTAILTTQRGKRAVPSLITFFSTRSNAYRHVIVDVTDSIVEEAWKRYKELCPRPDEEEFMGMVYKILNIDIPRMYRAVAPVVLKK